MKKNNILIATLLVQLCFISSVYAKCDFESFKFGGSYSTLMSNLKLDAEFVQSEAENISAQVIFVPGEEVCKNEKIFEGVGIDFIILYGKLVEIQIMRLSDTPKLVEWAESIYGEKENKPNSFYFEQPIANWSWENSKKTVAYSVETSSNEVMEWVVIQSLDHQDQYERFYEEQEGE